MPLTTDNYGTSIYFLNLQKNIVVHEIGHAIGWIHEQARPDRDSYIRINYNVIPPSWHSQFDKFASSDINDYDVDYDYRSIMHYSGNVRQFLTS